MKTIARIALAAIAAIVLLFTVTPVFADEIAQDGADYVRLTNKACSHDDVLARILPSVREYYMDARATVGGVPFRACWRAMGNRAVHLIYEDGDQGIVPRNQFKPVPEA